MTELFGVSLTLVMIVLLALLGVSVAAVVAVAVRNRVLFSIGVRNIFRRRAQSILIVLGLMLSTVIISAAFSTGDTVNYSITNDTYTKLGHVDEILQVQQNTRAVDLNREQIAPAAVIPNLITQDVIAGTNGNDTIDGVVPVLRMPVPASRLRDVTGKGPETSVPEVVVIGVDQRFIQGFEDDITAANGTGRVDLSRLNKFDALVNASTAKSLDIVVGDRIDLWINRQPKTVTVKGIVNDAFLTGWTQGQTNGIVIQYATALSLFKFNGAGLLAISNTGGVRDTVGLSRAAARIVRDSIGDSRFEVSEIKHDRIARAEELGSNITAIFVVLGLFSIAAGLLLVFLILVMLAAERRPEMGMSRAIGMKRLQLIESFMAEGMVYSMIAALIGAALGVLVSLIMARAMSYIFHSFDVGIVFHVTPRSLIIAYCIGVVLTFVTLVVSAWRVSNMSIVAAIREVNEAERPAPARQLGVIGPVAMVIGLMLVIVGRQDNLLPIAGIYVFYFGLIVGAVALAIISTRFFGIATVLLGLFVTGLGLYGAVAWAFGAGVSLIVLGVAFVARAFGLPARSAFTIAGVVVLLLWGLVAGDTLHAITGKLSIGIETFFISGVLMVAAATFIVIYNAELLLGAIKGVGFVFSRAVPAVRTSIAYPLANKFRTGMTIAMMSLVVFALVMISTMNLNFRRLFLSADARGGWDIELSEIPTNAFTGTPDNRLGPVGEALDRAFYDTRNIESISRVLVGHPKTTEITEVHADRSEGKSHSIQVLGADPTFLEQNTIGLQARATGFADDRAVWDAVRDDSNNAVIDGSVVPGINYANLTASRFALQEYKSGQRDFAPFPVFIGDSAKGKRKAIRVIGIMNRSPSETYTGVIVNQDAFNKALPALFARYYARLKPGVDADAEAKKMEAALSQKGVTAHSIQVQVEKEQRLNSSFFYLIQGFMALGLVVGIAALGVIAFRTVVERRQQIGLMRAIGFSRTNIALSFVLESAFVAVLGIVNGVWLALLLANRLLSSSEFKTAGFTSFYVPWLQIVIMALLVFVASVLTTLVPSRQASGIPIAEALRYE